MKVNLRSPLVYGIAAAALLAAVGCTKSGTSATAQLSASKEIPAAEGVVEASATDNDNTRLRVEVKHLAPVVKVAPDATTYVVWLQPLGNGRAVNMGALRVDDDLKGSLEATTPMHAFDVYITAEQSPTTMSPKGNRLMEARVERK